MATTTRGRGTRRASKTSTGPKPATRRRKRGFFRRYWWLFVVVPFVLLLGGAGTLFYVYEHLTVPATLPGPQTTYVYDDHPPRSPSST